MAHNLTQKVIAAHLASGRLETGAPLTLRIDEVATRGVTGERAVASGAAAVAPLNAVHFGDAARLHTSEAAFCAAGFWYARPGCGEPSAVQLERFAAPGRTALGSAAVLRASAALGMLTLPGTSARLGALLQGGTHALRMPAVVAVRLFGKLRDGVSGIDAALELLRVIGPLGAKGAVLEFCGPGLAALRLRDRLLLASGSGAVGALSSLFPGDSDVRRFLRAQGREHDFAELLADDGARFDRALELDLSTVEPLLALPDGSVQRVAALEGRPLTRVSVAPGPLHGFVEAALAAEILGTQPAPFPLELGPLPLPVLEQLARAGLVRRLLHGRVAVRTEEGRRGARHALDGLSSVELRTGASTLRCSPETAIASAAAGTLSDPRRLGICARKVGELDGPLSDAELLVPPQGMTSAWRLGTRAVATAAVP